MAGDKSQTAKSEEGPAKKKANPLEFIQQVRQEVAKVTWPTRSETIMTTIMVFIMCVLAALFFFLVDQVLGLIVSFVLGLGG
jgi:preprotein translocase subunit SecE